VAELILKPIGNARRMAEVSGAFIRMGYLQTMNYPLSFISDQIVTMTPIVTYHFIAKLVSPGDDAVAGDYYTFVILGFVATRLLAGTLRGVGDELEQAVQEGRFEALLVQPVPWKALPVGLAQWPIVWRFFNVAAAIVLSVILGANYRPSGLPAALIVIVLGAGATMCVGNLAAGVKLLAKRTDPILAFYSIAVFILAGVAYPVELLPRPIQVLSYAIPEMYVITALRKLLMPGGETLPGPEPSHVIIGLVAFNLIVFPFSLWVFGRILEFGRARGLLGGY
jgi:ABC-2 type transport system permease protein